MEDYFDKILARNAPQIQEALGYLEDVRVTKDYNEAMKELDQMAQERNIIKKYYDINNKIAGVDLSSVPTQKDITSYQFNTEHPEIYNTENPLMRKYYDYADMFTQSNPGKQPMGYQDFFENYPDLKQTAITMGLYKPVVKQEKMTPDEYRAKVHELAGLTPEESQFYTQMTGQLPTIEDYNTKLNRLLTGSYPNLVSQRGRLGDVRAKQYLEYGQNMGLTAPVKPKYTWKYEDGKLIGYDDQGEHLKIKDIAPSKKEQDTIKQLGYRITPMDQQDGTHYMVEFPQADGTWKPWGEVNEDQYAQWKTAQDEKSLGKLGIYERQKQISSQYRIQGNRRTGSTKMTKRDASNFGDIISYGKLGEGWDKKKSSQKRAYIKTEKELADRLFGGDVKKLQDYKEKLMGMTDAEAKKYYMGNRPSGSVLSDSSPSSKSGNTPLNTSTMLSNKSPSNLGDYMKNFYETVQNEDETAALDKVKGFFEGTIKAWGRSDLTAEQWRNEIAKHNEEFTDLEFAVLQKVFKDNFGEEL